MSSAAVAKTDSPSGLCVALFAMLAGGCVASPLGYATARTVAPQTVTHTVGFEGNDDAKVPFLPTYIVRVGVHERVDLGFRVANGIDVKANAIRTRYFDASFNPRVQVLPTRRDNLETYISLPVLLGLNPTAWLSLVGGAGPVFVYRTEKRQFFEGVLALDFHSRAFAMQPAIAFTRGYSGDDPTHMILGIGFTFGGVPVFD